MISRVIIPLCVYACVVIENKIATGLFSKLRARLLRTIATLT